MEQKAGAQISQRAFIQSLAILFVLMIAGILALVAPAGLYTETLKYWKTTCRSWGKKRNHCRESS